MNFINTMILSVKKFLSPLKHKRGYQIVALILIALSYSAYVALNDDRLWGSYRGNSETNAYSPLTQINKSNVQNLEVAWQFGPGNPAPAAGAAAPGRGFGGGPTESNPIIVDGVMYSSLARNKVYAVNSATGEQVWEYDPSSANLGGGVTRGVTYWEK